MQNYNELVRANAPAIRMPDVISKPGKVISFNMASGTKLNHGATVAPCNVITYDGDVIRFGHPGDFPEEEHPDFTAAIHHVFERGLPVGFTLVENENDDDELWLCLMAASQKTLRKLMNLIGYSKD